MNAFFDWVRSTWKGQPFRLISFIAVVSIVLIDFSIAPFRTTEGDRHAKRNEELLVQIAQDMKMSIIGSSHVSVRPGTANSAIVVSKQSWSGVGHPIFEREIISRGWKKAQGGGYCKNDMMLTLDENCNGCRGVVFEIDSGPTAKYKCSLSGSRS